MKKSTVLWLAALMFTPALIEGCSEDTTEKGTPGGDGSSDGSDTDGNADGNGQGDGAGDGAADGDANGSTQLDSNVAGSACSSSSDCAGTGTACLDSIGGFMGFGGTAAPGGYCSGTCTEDAQCGAGGVCAGAFAAAAIPGSCLKACQTDTDCGRAGYECVAGLELPDGGVPGFDGELPPQPSTCQPKPTTVNLDDGVAGKGCGGDADCGEGTCATTVGGVFNFGGTPAPGGYCTGACTEDAHCGAGGECVNLIPFGNMPGSCYRSCGSTCDREGYACGPVVSGNIPGGGGGFQIPEACVPEATEPDAGTPEPDAGTPELDGGV